MAYDHHLVGSQAIGLQKTSALWIQRFFGQLSFSHLLELSRIGNLTCRAFYELYSLKKHWSVRELQRQRDTMLYERIGLSESREEVLALARDGVIDESPKAQLRDPYVLEFLGLRRSTALQERDIEQALIEHLQDFLPELGRDFCFVGRQFRITVRNRSPLSRPSLLPPPPVLPGGHRLEAGRVSTGKCRPDAILPQLSGRA